MLAAAAAIDGVFEHWLDADSKLVEQHRPATTFKPGIDVRGLLALIF